MTTDLWALVASAALQWILILVAAVPRMGHKGLSWALSNREEPGKEMPAWSARLQRASDNLQENLLLFAIVVLVVHVAGKSSSMSATGSLVFLGARIGHAIVYWIGIPGIRTMLWATGVVGMFIVGLSLFM